MSVGLIQPVDATPKLEPFTAQEGTGTLAGRKVRLLAPEIGENREKTESLSWAKIARRVVVFALPVILGAVIGLVVGGPVGLAIGAASGIVASLSLFGAKKIYDCVYQKRFLRELPAEGGHKVSSESGKIGKYYEADVRLISRADRSLEWKKALIESAQESIEISANFAGGSSFREVLDCIEHKMDEKERVKTHMILSVDLLEDEDYAFLKKLQEKFGDRFQLLVTDRHYKLGLDLHTEENHIKMVVVDGKYFVGGGTSIHPRFCREEYNPDLDDEKPTPAAQLLEQASKDADVVGKSPKIAQALRDQFFNLYRVWEIRTTQTDHPSRYFDLKGPAGHIQRFEDEPGLVRNARMKALVCGPEHHGNNAIVQQYEKRILAAKDEIRLANLMFRPTKKVRNALKRATARRIAHLNGINPDSLIGTKTHTHGGRRYYSLLDTVYEYQGRNQTYHKKVAVFDNTHMIIGSFNLGKKSAKFDHELCFVLKNSEMATQCKKALRQDKKTAKKIGSSSCKKKSIMQRVISFMHEKTTENFL